MRQLIVVLLVLCALSFAGAADTETRTVTLGFVRATGLDSANAALRPVYEYAQQGDQPLWMEAERASALRFTPAKGRFAADPQASGGLYLAHVDHAEFHFTLNDPGAYTAWYRGSFPLVGNWNHAENMDGGESHIVVDSQGEIINQWIWTKGPTYKLAAGKHSWNLTPAGWCGGAGLDKLLLVKDPAFKPEGLGGAALTSIAPAGGQAVTETVTRRNVVRWGRFSYENLGKGTVAVEYSTDNSATWQPLPAGGDLSAVPPDKPVSFRLGLAAEDDGVPPYVSRVAVSYEAKRVPSLVLENNQVAFRFSGENGALLGIRNKLTNTDFLVPERETPLFSFTGLRPEFKTLVEIGFSQAELKQVTGPAQGLLTLAYELMGGGIQATVKVKLDGPLARFSMIVENKTIYDLSQVRLLSLKGLRIGEDHTDDYLCSPILTGAVAKNPAALEFPWQSYTDRPLAYPGMATTCFFDLYDAQGGGLYYACEDPQYRLTELTFSNGAEDKPRPEAGGAPLPPTDTGWRFAAVPGTYINLGFDKRMLINRRTGPVTVPDVVVGVHTGDWHWGADRYREWAQSWMPQLRQTPDWLRDMEGWTNLHMTHLGRFVDLTKADHRPTTGRGFTFRDPPAPFLATWAQQASAEAYWATPVLHLLLGTEEEFAAGLQKQHEMGHRFICYNLPSNINPTFHQGPGGMRAGIVPLSMYPDDQLPPLGFYPEVGVRLYDGSLREPDGLYCEANVCNAAPKWLAYNRHIVLDKYILGYGNDGMYLDGAGLYDLGTQDCKNLGHGHSDYGVWTNGFLNWLREVKVEARKARPGAVFCGEGMSDVYHTQLDLGLFYPDNNSSVLRYTIPWNIGMILGYKANTIAEWPDGLLEYATVYGIKYGGPDPQRLEKSAQFTAFRARWSQLQFRARFLDDQGLSVGDPQVRAKLYARDDANARAALVVAWNAEKKVNVPCSVDKARVGKLAAAWYYTLQGGPYSLPVQEKAGRYNFALPGEEMCAVVLLERCEPMVVITPSAPTVPGERGVARVSVTNLEPRELSGQVSLRLPAGWTGETKPLRLASGRSADFSLGFTVARDARFDVADIYAVTRDGNRLTDKCVTMGVCRPVWAQLNYTRRDQIRLTMTNNSGQAVAGTCRFLPPAGVTADPAETPFNLAPKGQGELSFRLAGVETVTTLQHVKAVLSYDNLETVAYEVLQPPVLNGGFEQSTGGDGWPDYWNYRRPESLYLKGVVLDTEDKVEGRQSLRIEPNLRDNENALQTTYLRLIPNTRYRVSCAIKCGSWKGVGFNLQSMGNRPPGQQIVINLGGKDGDPVNTWQRFSAEFTSGEIEMPYLIHLANWGKNPYPAWFDDIKIEEVE